MVRSITTCVSVKVVQRHTESLELLLLVFAIYFRRRLPQDKDLSLQCQERTVPEQLRVEGSFWIK